MDGALIGEACYVILNDAPISPASAAEEKCQEIGATLAMVKTQEVYDGIYEYLDGLRNGQRIDVTLGGTYDVSVNTTIYYACQYLIYHRYAHNSKSSILVVHHK